MPRLRQQRHVRREQLGDAAAVRGGVDVQDPRAPERLGQRHGSARPSRRRRPRRSRRDPSRGGDTRRARDAPGRARAAAEGAPGRSCAVNLSTDAPSRTRVSRQVPRHARRRAEAAAAMARGLRRAGFDEVGRSRSPTAATARSTRCSLLAVDRAGPHASPGPLGDAVDAEWALLPRRHRGGRDGARERARARRRATIRSARRRAGPGELIDAARRSGARRASSSASGARATTDGGLGAVEALGWSLGGIEVTVACDVTTRSSTPRACTGRRRARATRRSSCSRAGSPRWRRRTTREPGSTSRELEGTGAAGGLAGGLAALGARPRARLRRGRGRRGPRRRARRRDDGGHRRGRSSTSPASRARWWAGCSSGRPTLGVPHRAVIAGQVTDEAREELTVRRRQGVRARRPRVAGRRGLRPSRHPRRGGRARSGP